MNDCVVRVLPQYGELVQAELSKCGYIEDMVCHRLVCGDFLMIIGVSDLYMYKLEEVLKNVFSYIGRQRLH